MGSLPSVIGPYRVIRPLGEGGMGAVFEAVHEVIQRRVAIKVLHPEAGRSTDTINRFINEARAANLIGHPGLVQITDFGNLPDGSGYLVMEYLEGQTLSSRLESSGGKLSPSETVQIGIQIASALATAHKKGIIHRDLKPSNVMLVSDPAMPTGERLKILDFGLAKLAAVREAAIVKTNSLAVLGTPLYMSPEQCQGAGQVDEKSDVYSLGCILYEALSGQTPFTGSGPGEVIGKHLFKSPEPLHKLAPQVSSALASLVDRLLVKPKEERPAMREVRQELEALAASLPPPLRREESGAYDQSKFAQAGLASTLGQGAAEDAPSAKPKRRAAFIVAGLVPLLSLSLGVALWSRQPSRMPIATSNVGAVAAPANPAAASAVPARQTGERTIRWSIESTPVGASLVNAQGIVVGATPWTLVRPAGSGTQEFRIRKPGYVERLLVLRLDADEVRAESLEALSPPPARKKPGPSTPSPAAPAKKPAAPASPPKKSEKDLFEVPLVH